MRRCCSRWRRRGFAFGGNRRTVPPSSVPFLPKGKITYFLCAEESRGSLGSGPELVRGPAVTRTSDAGVQLNRGLWY